MLVDISIRAQSFTPPVSLMSRVFAFARFLVHRYIQLKIPLNREKYLSGVQVTFKFDTLRRNPDLKVERYAYSIPSEELARFALFRRRCDYRSYSSLTKLIASLGKMIYSTLETRHPASSVSLSVSSLFVSLSPFLRPLYLSSSRVFLSQAISPFFSFIRYDSNVNQLPT